MTVTLDDLRTAMTKKQFAEVAGTSLTTVDRLIAAGEIEVIHIGAGRGHVRITQRAATEYLNHRVTKKRRPATATRGAKTAAKRGG